MNNPDGVLAAIDACLHDYDVGPDAMRWAPDEPDPTSPGTGRWYGWDSVHTVVDEAHTHLASGWPTLEHIASDGTSVPWDGRCAEWQYTIVETDPVVVETRRHGQPWGAHLLTGLPTWQREYMNRMVSQYGRETIFEVRAAHPVVPVVPSQREAWVPPAWRALFGPQPLAETVFGASLPEPDDDAPADPPTLPAPVLPPTDGSAAVSLSESARHALGSARRLPNTDAPETPYNRRRSRP